MTFPVYDSASKTDRSNSPSICATSGVAAGHAGVAYSTPSCSDKSMVFTSTSCNYLIENKIDLGGSAAHPSCRWRDECKSMNLVVANPRRTWRRTPTAHEARFIEDGSACA
jgi:hypothetical protein